MHKKEVNIDILSANYNNGEYLKRFIESIINSSVWPKQLIIIDDASTDNSIDIINSFSCSKLNIKLIKLKQNVGFANALNAGVLSIKSKYVLRIDPDDIIHSERIQKQYSYLEKNNLIDLVGSNVTYFSNSEDNITGQSNFPLEHFKIVESYKNGSHGVCHGAVTFKSTCLLAEQYKQENVPAEEYDIFSRFILKKYRFANISETLTSVRIHSLSVSNNMPYSTVEKTFKLREVLWGYKASRLYIFKEFIARSSYRKYISSKSLTRYVPLILAASLKPIATLKRLLNNEK